MNHLVFFLARIDEAVVAKHLQQSVSYYFLQNFYVTPSGMFTLPPFLNTLQMIGADRIMYAVDYPYI
jgi:predicted TIM-barrel fold metal-dependent hydrolase